MSDHPTPEQVREALTEVRNYVRARRHDRVDEKCDRAYDALDTLTRATQPPPEVVEAWERVQARLRWSDLKMRERGHPDGNGAGEHAAEATIDTYLNGKGSPERVALLEAVAYGQGSGARAGALWRLVAYDREHGIGDGE